MGPIQAIGYNLTNLLTFKGRATRFQFWPYAVFVFFVAIAGVVAIMMPEMAASMERMHQFAAEHPDQVTVRQSPGSYSITVHGNHPELAPDFSGMLTRMFLCFAVIVVLLAAAVARRLHDRGKSALWGLMPVPFIAFACFAMTTLFNQFGEGEPDMALFMALFVNNLLYLGALIYLIVLLCGASTKGENKYGPMPA